MNNVKATPWDQKIFGFPTWELTSLDHETLEATKALKGHVTAKVQPDAPCEPLSRYGFYYTDTLLIPYCRPESLRFSVNPKVTLSRNVDRTKLESLVDGAFTFGRFHRDFNVTNAMADRRYTQWFLQLAGEGNVFALEYEGAVAGYFGYTGPKIALHALLAPYRGRGLAKYFWSEACRELFRMGHEEISSSVSADNMAVLNLYISLGFKFRAPVHCYHRFIAS